MANVKISDLPAATTPLTGNELVEVVQSGVSSKVAALNIGNSATAVPYASLTGRAYISAISTADQTGSTLAGTAAILPSTTFSSGISITSNGVSLTRVTFAVAGTYAIMPSIQFVNSDASDHKVCVWFRKNGTDITASATYMVVPKTGDGGHAFFQIVFYDQVTAGQYIEIMWQPDNAAITMDYIASTATAPASPSIILTAERIA